MRVLILSQYFYPEVGAAPIRLYEIAREFCKRGYRVTVVTTFPSHRLGAVPREYRRKFFMREKVENFEILRIWSYPYTSEGFWKRLLTYFSFTLFSLIGAILAGKCDLIFVYSPPLFLGIPAYLASLIKRAPFVFNVSDLWPRAAVELGIVRNRILIKLSEKLEFFIYKKAWKILAVTEGIRETLLEKELPPSKVNFFPNGANIQIFAPKKKRKDLIKKYNLEGKKVFLYAGNFGYALDVKSILEAAKILHHRDDICFLLVGEGPEKARLEKLTHDMKLSNVHFVNSQPFTVIPDYYALSVAAIVPLKRSGLSKSTRPAKVYAAMACQKAVIYCGEGEAADIIREANCGIVVEPENPQALMKAVLEIANDLKRAEEMGKNGRKYIKNHYTWDLLMSKWLDEVGLPQRVTEKSRKIWIDITNSPSVLVFYSIIKELKRRGHFVMVTARDYAQTVPLLNKYAIDYTLIGKHMGRSIVKKIFGLLYRSLRLIIFSLRKKADLAVSHNSNDLAVATFFLRIPHVVMFDYEYAEVSHRINFKLVSNILVPEAIPQDILLKYGAKPEKIIKYPGFKEQIYLPDLPQEDDLPKKLKLDESKITIAMRPPATMALYHRFENELFLEILRELMSREDVNIILLPRTAEQREQFSRIVNERVIIPSNVIGTHSLLHHTDLMIGAGGTMNREAALIGLPVYTVFRGRIGALDQMLIREGKLKVVDSLKDITLIKRTNKEKMIKSNLKEVVDKILSC